MNRNSFKNDCAFAYKHVKATKEWVVVVSLNKDSAEDNRQQLSFLAPFGDFSGRTLSLPNGGRITVVSAEDDWSCDKPFTVIFSGVSGKKAKTSLWESKAAYILKVSSI